ncbi:MAG: ABC transporter permease [Gemmatimonadaceae bacterium]
MRPRTIRALLMASWKTSLSYRMQMATSLASLLLTVVPVYFVANALQNTMAGAIAREGTQYFGFLLVGTVTLSLVTTAVSTLPQAVSGGIASGYFEMLLMSPAPRLRVLIGLSAYGILWTMLRGVLTLLAGWVLGARLALSGVPAAVLILAVIVVAHWAIGLFGTALVLAFRSMGPLPQVVLFVSALFGGTYFPTSQIPSSWLQTVSAVTPLAYGLRALRRVLLDGQPLSGVLADFGVLLGMCVVLLVISAFAFSRSLNYAKRQGSLNLY